MAKYHAAQWQDYCYVLVDAAYFGGLIPKDYDKLLHSRKYCVASTFDSEVAAYREIITPREKKFYQLNDKLLGQIERTTLVFTPEELGGQYLNDIWGSVHLAAVYAAKENARCLLITCNQILAAQVLYRENRVDILFLSPNGCELISPEDIENRRSLTLFRPAKRPVYVVPELGESLVLYDENGQAVSLTDAEKDGAESRLYRSEAHPDMLAKVFREDKLDAEKIANVIELKKLADTMPQPWALLPRKLLYWDEKKTYLAGFFQNEAVEVSTMERPLYYASQQSPEDRPSPEELSLPAVENLRRCIRLVRQIAYLETKGFGVSDFNNSNFGFSAEPDRADQIYMWDTDSFCSRVYPARNQSPDSVIPWKYRNGRGFESNYITCTEFCTEMLYEAVFSFLSLGEPALDPESRTFRRLSERDHRLLLKAIPVDVWEVIRAAFEQGCRSTTAALLHALMEGLKYWEENKPDYSYLDYIEDLDLAAAEQEDFEASDPTAMEDGAALDPTARGADPDGGLTLPMLSGVKTPTMRSSTPILTPKRTAAAVYRKPVITELRNPEESHEHRHWGDLIPDWDWFEIRTIVLRVLFALLMVGCFLSLLIGVGYLTGIIEDTGNFLPDVWAGCKKAASLAWQWWSGETPLPPNP